MRAAVLLTLILVAGCAKNENNCTPSSQFYTFHLNKSIDTSGHTVSLVNGGRTVFTFQYNYEQCEGVVGAAVSREIYFAIPSATQNSFSYSNDLTDANALIYRLGPFSPSSIITSPLQGSIQGTQISSTRWHIKAAVSAGGDIIQFEQDFLKTE